MSSFRRSNATMFWIRNLKFVSRVVSVFKMSCYSNRTDFNLLLLLKRWEIKIIRDCRAHHRLKGTLQTNIKKKGQTTAEVWYSVCLLQTVTAKTSRVEITILNEGDSILYLITAVTHIVYRLAWEES